VIAKIKEEVRLKGCRQGRSSSLTADLLTLSRVKDERRWDENYSRRDQKVRIVHGTIKNIIKTPPTHHDPK
jgi:hypothetical protein